MDTPSFTQVACIELGGTGAIDVGDHSFSYTISGRRALDSALTVTDLLDSPVITLTWIEANTMWKPFGLGRAIISVTELDPDAVVLVVCLAFYAFAAAFTPTGGG